MGVYLDPHGGVHDLVMALNDIAKQVRRLADQEDARVQSRMGSIERHWRGQVPDPPRPPLTGDDAVDAWRQAVYKGDMFLGFTDWCAWRTAQTQKEETDGPER